MASISPEQKEQVISLVREDKLSNDEIAIRVGVSRGTVSAIKAHFTRGSYGALAATDAETDELIEAAETTFGAQSVSFAIRHPQPTHTFEAAILCAS